MAKVILHHVLKDDQALIQMDVDGEPKAHMFVEASDLSKIIAALSEIRMQMTEEVTPVLDPVARLDMVVDPAWRAELKPEGTALALRHPGLGWIGFLLPPESASELAEHLPKPLAEPGMK